MHDNAEYTLRIQQIVPSRTDQLHRIREVVEAEAQKFGFDEETAYRLALAVDEACTNIIKHSYRGDPSQTFDLEIATIENRFLIILTDHGQGFTPDKSRKYDMKRYFERMRRGGLGLHIIKLVMDDVDYDVTTKNSNRLRMVKYLGKF
jgi:serine/threonine-protein kinase RsbW